MDIASFNSSGKPGKKVAVDDSIFSVSVRPSIIHSVVRWQRAKKRAGTHSTLNRAAMEGGKKKPWKQKGTGRARAGTRNSPLWVGGAVAFGPSPRSYEFKLPRKVRRQALLGVLSNRAASESVVVAESFGEDIAKTSQFLEVLKNLQLAEGNRAQKGRVAFVYSSEEENAFRAARNIEGVECLTVDGVNVYDLLRCKKILISAATLQQLEEKLGRAAK